MARNTNVTVAAKAWTELTASDVLAITFQNLCGAEIFVKATVGATEPEDLDGAVRYEFGQGERGAALTDLFPGVSGANRVFAWSKDAGEVMVSHA